MKQFELYEIKEIYSNFAYIISNKDISIKEMDKYAFEISTYFLETLKLKRPLLVYYSTIYDCFMICNSIEKESPELKLIDYIHKYANPKGVYILEKLALDTA